jgi:hypothetical protein
LALKFLPLHVADDPDRLARFRKEAAAARRVSHPNVCRVYDIAEHEAVPSRVAEHGECHAGMGAGGETSRPGSSGGPAGTASAPG